MIKVKIDKSSIPDNLFELHKIVEENITKAHEIIDEEFQRAMVVTEKLFGGRYTSLDKEQWGKTSLERMRGLIGIFPFCESDSMTPKIIIESWVYFLRELVVALSVGGSVYLDNDSIKMYKEVLEECEKLSK